MNDANEKDITYFAHSGNGLPKESLKHHLLSTAELAKIFCEKFGCGDIGYLCGLFHDIGKYQSRFQKKLDGYDLVVEHSTCGAIEIYKQFWDINSLYSQMMAHIILGHHSGLPDTGTIIDTIDDSTLIGRMKRPFEDYTAYKESVDCEKLRDILRTAKPPKYSLQTKNDLPFEIAVYTKMIFSALTDADFLKTEEYFNGGILRKSIKADFQEMKKKLDNALAEFDNLPGFINKKRNEILFCCRQKAVLNCGLYSLTVPTGGGKTLSSLAFALNHLIEHKLDRIIYVIPYTSITQQTALNFKEIFGEEFVLEHHSNFDFETLSKKDDTALIQKYATENWDMPIIVTTNVQFFQSFFSNRTSKCRKLHNIAKSVIIFDEAQMLPIKYIKPCLRAVDLLTRDYNCTALFMTATKPDFLPQMYQSSKIIEINDNFEQHYKDFKRVKIINLGKQSDAEIIKRLECDRQALVVLNTRKHAKAIFDGVQSDSKYHLSTLMTPLHRMEVLEEIKTILAQGKECIVVSTQLIECGVDLDFEVVYRSLAGLDSIVQAAGRCNRGGNRPLSNVYVFESLSEYDANMGDIGIYKAITNSIIGNYKDLSDLDAITDYFKELYNFKDNETDNFNIEKCFDFRLNEKDKYLELKFNFDECAQKFNYIEQVQKVEIIIPNEDSVDCINKLKFLKASGTEKIYPIIRKLHQYIVSVYRYEAEKLKNKGKLEMVSENLYILLDKDFYNDHTGLTLCEEGNSEAFIL